MEGFPIVATTNCHKSSDFTEMYYLMALEVNREVNNPSGYSRKNHAFPFSASRGDTHCLAHGCITPILAFSASFLDLPLRFPPSSSLLLILGWPKGSFGVFYKWYLSGPFSQPNKNTCDHIRPSR